MYIRENGHIKSTSVSLASVGRDLTITSIDFNSADGHIYASIQDGRIIKISSQSKVIKVIRTVNKRLSSARLGADVAVFVDQN